MTTSTYEEFVKQLDDEANDFPCDECSPSVLELEYPPWFDAELFRKGQKYILHHFSSQLAVCINGLLSVLAQPASLSILIKTHKSSTTLSGYRRYLSTILHFYSWLRSDFQPGSKAWKSLLTVRKRHLRASKQSETRGDGKITQKDMVTTLVGFYGYGLVKPSAFGFQNHHGENSEAYLFFWRTIGFMVGVHDKYNLCSGPPELVLKKTEYVCDKILKPHLENPPEYYYHMAIAMLDGMFYISGLISTKAMLYHVYRLNNIQGFQTKKDIARLLQNDNYNPLGTEKSICKKPSQEKSVDKNEVKVIQQNGNHKVISKNTNCLKYNQSNINVLNGSLLWESMVHIEQVVLLFMIYVYENVLSTNLGRILYNGYFHISLVLMQYISYPAVFKFGFKAAKVNIFTEDVAIPTKMKTNCEVLEMLYRKGLELWPQRL